MLPWTPVCCVLMTLSAVVVAVSFVMPHVLRVPLDAWAAPGRAWFDVGNENNLPTWWNAALLMVAAALASVVACVSWNGRRAKSPGTAVWWLIGLLLAALSLDEVASLHERLGRLADAALPGHGFTYAWLAVGIPMALALLTGTVFVTRSLAVVPRRLLLAGLLVLFAGAVGLEAANDILVRLSDQADAHNPHLFHVIYHAEELLELLGACLLVTAPLSSVQVNHYPDGVVVKPR